jgi:Flp pilus assembly protein TadG
MSLPLLVIMVPVLLAMMGFAIDLGRLYLVRGELNQAANAMALAGAQQLLGTSASLGNATTAAQQSLDNTIGDANQYYFGSLLIGQSSGILNSTVNPPAFYDTMADANAAASGASTQADGTTARYVQISLTGDTPLIFWALMPGGESRKTTIAGQALAGISSPLCTACGIEPFAIAALDSTDLVNFGFGDPSALNVYTFAYSCTGTPAPVALTGSTGVPAVIPYVLLNRYDASNANYDQSQQIYRDAAGGLIASTDPNPSGSAVPIGCVGIGDTVDTIWASASPSACALSAGASVVDALCGLRSRFDSTDPSGACTTDVTDWANLVAAFPPDPDVVTAVTDPYTSYTGNGRRIITVAIVQALPPNLVVTMTILGFRQFFVEVNADGSYINPSDPNGRFAAMYIGNPAPVPQGWVDDRFGLAGGNLPTSGPGKVVLHQ